MLVRVADIDELGVDSLRRVEIEGQYLCLVRTSAGWYAIDDVCSHEEYPLSEGDLWGSTIECPMHGSRFDLETGEPDQLPAIDPVKTYRVTVRDGGIFVDL